jgi:hypothetical protein
MPLSKEGRARKASDVRSLDPRPDASYARSLKCEDTIGAAKVYFVWKPRARKAALDWVVGRCRKVAASRCKPQVAWKDAMACPWPPSAA